MMQTTQSHHPRRFKQRGFTLIELLIVVAIIGILAAVGVPQYGNYLNRAEQNACIGELNSFRSLAVASNIADEGDPNNIDEFVFQSCGDGVVNADLVTLFNGTDDSAENIPITTPREQTVTVTTTGRIVAGSVESGDTTDG